MTKEMVMEKLARLFPTGTDIHAEFHFTSLQTIKLVAKIEKNFQIEFEDQYIFRGLFKNIEVLASYVMYQQGCRESITWEKEIEQNLK